MKKRKIIEESKTGFTIVELTLTMSFVAVLLITIAIVVTNVLAIYQKGMTIKAVNNVGRGLIDNLSDSITGAPGLNVTSVCAKLEEETARTECEKDNATRGFNYNSAVDSDGHQLYGVFCTGSYSYVWNTAYAFKSGTLAVKYTDMGGNEATIGKNKDGFIVNDVKDGEALIMARFRDTNRRICSASIDKSNYESVLTGYAMEIDATKYLDSDNKLGLEDPETGLLKNNDTQLLLHELTIFPRAEDEISGRAFYAGTFILATERGDINVKSASEYCRNSETSSTGNLGAEFNYCALNKFNFAARTAGE